MKEDKSTFVKALGAALAYSRTGVLDLDYHKDADGGTNKFVQEGVTIVFADGDERTINVTADSCLAIVHDVYRELI